MNVSENAIITVTAANRAPVLASIPAQTVTEGEMVRITPQQPMMTVMY